MERSFPSSTESGPLNGSRGGGVRVSGGVESMTVVLLRRPAGTHKNLDGGCRRGLTIPRSLAVPAAESGRHV